VEDVERTPSTAMFLAAARRRNHHFALEPADVPAIARICTRLEGLPLALELAAARTGTLGVGQLAADLDTRLDGLGPGPRDAPARHRTLEATIEWSFTLLEPHLQTVFAQFAVFAGGATLDAAQAIIGVSSDAFEALVTKNMIATRSRTGGGMRLVMLDTLRHYAGRRLARDPGEGELRRRHLDHYLTVVETAVAQFATRDERLALEALDREIENIQAAREWALEHEPNLCLRLTGHVAAYWGLRRQPAALGWCEAALRAAGDDAPVRDRARAEQHRARQLALGNRYDASIEAANRALALYTQADDHAGIAKALWSLAFDTGELGDLEQSRRYAESAVRYARTSGDDVVLAKALSELAACAHEDDRASLVEEAAGIFTRLGDDSGLARLYTNCGYVELTKGRVEQASELFEAALNVPRSGATLHLPALLSNLLSNLGLARLFSGDPHAARLAFVEALGVTLTGYGDYVGESFAGLAAIAAIGCDDEVAARLRGAAGTAGYPPPSEFDRSIDQRLTRDYLTAALERLGPVTWQGGTATRTAWTTAEATEYAITWASAGIVGETDVVAATRPARAHAGSPRRR